MTTRAHQRDGRAAGGSAFRSHPHTTRTQPRRRGRRFVVAAAVAVGLLPLALAGSDASAAPGDIGTEDHAYVEATNPTVSKAESKVWFQDGSWYAVLLKTGTPSATGRPNADHYIYRLTNGTWAPTATLVDDRGTTKVDVVSSGNTLYVSSHKFVGNATGEAQISNSNKTWITKFTYDPATKTYTKVAGFPKVLNDFQMESLSIDIDGSGVLWAAWVQASKVYWQRSVDGGSTWSAPAALGDPNATTSADDIASIVTFGNRVGIMWSDQAVGHDGFWFSHANNGAGPTFWSAAEAVYTGPGVGDDHVNLKAVDGQVYAAVKTRTDAGGNPLIVVLHRDGAGTWSHHTAWIGSTNTTRPVIQIDTTHQTAEVFATGPEVAGGDGEAGGVIYRKSAPLSTLSFGAGLGEKVMSRPTTGHINDTSGTKQPVSTQTGLVVIASDSVSLHYWHHAQGLVRVGPTAPSGVTATAGIGKVFLKWTAATPGDLPIDHYRVTATPALPSALADFPASATGTVQQITAPNNVSRVFHVQAVAGGTTGPAADSMAVTPNAYLPFNSPESFADQQARDFLGRNATAGEKSAARTAFVNNGASGPQVVLAAPYFADPTVAAGDGTGPEARVTRLYFAYFLRAPDRSGYDYWLRQLRSGQSLEAISRRFAASSEFKRRYGTLTDEGFVNLVYKNLFNRAPDSGGKAYWLKKLGTGFPRGTMMTQFSESSEYRRTSARRVEAVIVYRHMLQRLPTASQLAAELAKASTAVTVADIIASSEYGGRIVR